MTALLGYKYSIELMYTNSCKKHCYPILASFMIDYKKQVLITGIKTNIQCYICHILPKIRALITRL